jgi:mono/diheme cytochrome c family protein
MFLINRTTPLLLVTSLALASLAGCAMSEEMRRIQLSKRSQQLQDASRSTNLTGEEVFIRSCNTCHVGGKTLENMPKDFPDDRALKSYIRRGKGTMPAQPKEIINDEEMDRLVLYLRNLNAPQ